MVLKRAGQPESKQSSEFHLPKLGEEVPDFALVNQDGKRVRFRHYRGKAVLLTFIYTRCPLPDYCPRMSSNFAEIIQTLRREESVYARTHFLSISFDPTYDTPKVLRAYGAPYARENGKPAFNHWEFAFVPHSELKEVVAFFGLTYWEEQNQIAHSMSTALISPEGKLYRWYPGNEWKTADVLGDLMNLLNASANAVLPEAGSAQRSVRSVMEWLACPFGQKTSNRV